MPNRSIPLLLAAILCGVPAARARTAGTIPKGGKSIIADPLAAFARTKSNAKGSVGVVEARGPGFTKALEVKSNVRANDWDYQVYLHVSAPVRKGDVLLVHFWARTVQTADESGRSRIKAAVELPNLWRRPPKERELLAPLTRSVMVTAGTEWKQFFIRAQSPRNVPAGGLWVALRSGMERQRVQFGAVDIINFGHSLKVADLPFTRATYAGRQAGAPWRKAADARIQQHRTRKIRIVVRDRDGKPIKGAAVKLELKRHAFGFGAAFRASDVLEEFNPDYETCRRRILENFHSASFVNALKWHAWAGDWGRRHGRKATLESLKWVAEQKLPFRGHCLVWPRKASVSKAMRKRLEARNPDPRAIQRGILEHIRSIAPATAFWMAEWDVLNESIPCHDVQDICGDDVMVEWFKETRRLLPNVKLALNEYGILSSVTDGEKVGLHEKRIRYLLDRGAPVDVLGMQSHMGASPPGPERILKLLNRFAEFGLPIRATEFDIKSTDKELLYDFTRDFYTVMFSHPSVIGVQMWGFGQMYEEDGGLSPIGKAYRELVSGVWHTKAEGTTDSSGAFAYRGFLGTYAVSFTRDGSTVERTFTVPAGEGTCLQALSL